MTRPSTSTNMTIFLLFFGISVLDAVATRNWWRVGFWLLIAVAFLGASFIGRGQSADDSALR